MTERNAGDVTKLELHLLVLRCQIGDEGAFNRLMEQFGSRTRRYLRGLVGDSADDVQQEVWLAVYRGVASLANPRAFRTWLYQLTRRRAIDFLRRESRERELLSDVETAASELIADPVQDDLSDSTLDAIDALPPPQREVLLLRYRDDMPYAEIALIMGCSVGTVRSRLHYAKQKLYELVEHTR